MKKNMSQTEQYIRLILAFYIFALMRMKSSGTKKFLGPIGMMFLLTGLSGYCSAYALIDMLD